FNSLSEPWQIVSFTVVYQCAVVMLTVSIYYTLIMSIWPALIDMSPDGTVSVWNPVAEFRAWLLSLPLIKRLVVSALIKFTMAATITGTIYYLMHIVAWS
ncbi:MAG: hypothetical protein AAB865_01315, partial [Patescibacteria group bacterium]